MRIQRIALLLLVLVVVTQVAYAMNQKPLGELHGALTTSGREPTRLQDGQIDPGDRVRRKPRIFGEGEGGYNEDHEYFGELANISCRRRAGRTAVPGKGGRAKEGDHECHPKTPRRGPEPLARQHHAKAPHQRHLTPLHRRILDHGAHLEPHDLRPRHHEQSPTTTTTSARSWRRASRARRCSSTWRSTDLTTGRRPVPPGPRAGRTAWTAGCRWRSLRCWPTTRPAPSPRPSELSRRGRAAQPLHQDPRHAGGPPRHRGGDLRGRADQRDAAVLPRALRGGRRGVPAGHRAAHRRRSETRRRLRGFSVREPLGRRGLHGRAPERCATGSGSPSPGARTRRTATCSIRRAGSALSTPAPARSASCGPAPGPRTPRPPTSSTSRRSPRRSRSTPSPKGP